MRRVDFRALAASAAITFLTLAISENLYSIVHPYIITVSSRSGYLRTELPYGFVAALVSIITATVLAAYLQIFGALPIIYALSFAKKAGLPAYIVAGMLTMFVAHPLLFLIYAESLESINNEGSDSDVEFWGDYYIYYAFWRSTLTSLHFWMCWVPASIACSPTYWYCRKSRFPPASATQGSSRIEP